MGIYNDAAWCCCGLLSGCLDETDAATAAAATAAAALAVAASAATAAAACVAQLLASKLDKEPFRLLLGSAAAAMAHVLWFSEDRLDGSFRQFVNDIMHPEDFEAVVAVRSKHLPWLVAVLMAIWGAGSAGVSATLWVEA